MSTVRNRGINASDNGEAQKNVVGAAMSAPKRKRRPQKDGPVSFLTTWENAPQHIRDNEFIRRGYRAGYNFNLSLKSIFTLHNETGNIWTHLIGFVIFIFLTVATFQLRPAPLRLGAEALGVLETRLTNLGKRANLYDLLQTAGAWERAAWKYGADSFNALEDRLRGIGAHNVGDELSSLVDALASRVGTAAKSLRAYGMAELAHVEEQLGTLGSELTTLKSEALREAEGVLHRALAAVLDPSSRWPVPRWPLYVFMAGAMLCLLTSSVCHLFGCCAAHIAAVMWRFDYAGIAVLIFTSFFPPVYYGFLCRPFWRLAYLFITGTLGLSTLSVTLLDKFQSPAFHTYRAALFVGLGLWGVVPMMHGLVVNAGVKEVATAMQLDVLMGAIYIGGAVIYATKVPERWKPGAFDVAFHSHQLFHVAVVVAALVHYRASRELLNWRDATGGCMAL